MLRKYASLIIAFMLVALVVSACVVRSSRTSRRGQPVYVEKHKPQKHKDHGKHKGRKH